MHKMSNLEYSFIVRELGLQLNGKHFGRIRKIGENVYRMKLAGVEILCELGVRIHSTKYIEPAESDKFTEKVEKELDNARLSEIRQINNDRIVSFVFDKGELIFEMFGEGNAILVKGGNAVCAHKYESWSDREIKAGAPYKPPKTAPAERLEVTDKYIIVSLMKLPLGKDYALEALSRLKIDEKTPGNSLSGNQIMKLEQEIARLQAEAKPAAFFENGKMLDFALARLSKYSKLETAEPGTLSEAADEYYAHLEKTNPKLDKLKERLEKQSERLSELQGEEKADKEKGDFIYANFQKAEEIIALAKSDKAQELEKKYSGKMDKKEKSVEADL
jgi:predicted ribosome quality control (RQC) complex YloA/Tae2 family protein